MSHVTPHVIVLTQRPHAYGSCRPLPESVYGEQAQHEPLLGVRRDTHSPELGETLDSLPLLERLLRCQHEPAHEAISACLWDRSAAAGFVSGQCALQSGCL